MATTDDGLTIEGTIQFISGVLKVKAAAKDNTEAVLTADEAKSFVVGLQMLASASKDASSEN